MKKRIAVLILAAATAAALLAGCGKNDKQTAQDSSAETSEAAAENDTITDSKTLLAATDYDVKDYVKLMDDYMGMDVNLTSDYTVTDEAVKSYIEDYILPYYPLSVETDKTIVEDGDVVDIDFEGKLNGETIDEGTAEGYLLTIGSDSFIDGFEDGLIGKEVGGTYDLDLTFPENYGSEKLAGQDVVFTVTVNAIVDQKTITYEEMNDDYIADNFSAQGINNLESMNSFVKQQLTSEYENDKNYEIQDLVLGRLEAESEVTFPEGLLEQKIQNTIDSIKAEAESSETEYEEYVSTYYGQTAEELEQYINETMEDQLKQELVLEAIVKDQDISVSENAFNSFVNNYVTYYGMSSEDEFYDSYGGKDYVRLIFAESTALNNVVKAANAIPFEGETTEE